MTKKAFICALSAFFLTFVLRAMGVPGLPAIAAVVAAISGVFLVISLRRRA